MDNKRPAPRLVVADVDGTIIGQRGDVSEAAVSAVARTHAAGWHVALATGRMVERVRAIAAKLRVPVVICTEGSLIYSLAIESPLLTHTVSPQIIAETVATLQTTVYHYGLATAERLYARCPEFARLFSPWADSVEAIQRRPLEDGVLMLVTFGPYEEMILLCRDWQVRFDRQVQLVLEHTAALPDGGLIKILNPKSDKGQSALWLAESLGLASSDVIAFGDWLNDIPLLRRAGLRIVPDNAVPEVKALADYISPFNVDGDFFARELTCILDQQLGQR